MIDTPDLIAFTPGLAVGGEPPSTPGMTAAELRMTRERLGLTSEVCAEMLALYDAEQVDADALAKARRSAERKMRRWEQGQNQIPETVREGMELLERVHLSTVIELVKQLDAAESKVLAIPAGDTANFPGGWWRAVAYEVAVRVPGLRIKYADA